MGRDDRRAGGRRHLLTAGAGGCIRSTEQSGCSRSRSALSFVSGSKLEASRYESALDQVVGDSTRRNTDARRGGRAG
jgi:hypothetical protein